MMEITHKEALIGIGVTLGAAILVIFLRKPATNAPDTSGDIAGGFPTAGTVYVPTSSYNIVVNKATDGGDVNYTTGTAATTPAPAPTTVPVPIHLPTPPPPTPVIVTTSPGKINLPTAQTGKTGHAPAPKAAPTPVHQAPSAPKSMGTIHYATPKSGFDSHSVVDYVKEHGGNASFAGRAALAAQNGIKGYTGTAAQNVSLLSKLKAKYH